MVEIPGGFTVLPEQPMPPMMISRVDALADLSAALRAARLDLQGAPILDGKIHRTSEIGSNKRGDDACWYIVFEADNGHLIACFGNWRSGGTDKWSSKNESEWTAADRAAFKRAREAAQLEIEASRKEAAAKAAATAETLPLASADHPYLVTKGIKPHGAQMRGADLLLPLRDIDGNITTYQTISPTGDKRYAKGGAKQASFYLIGEVRKAIYITEGFATGATIREAKGEAVVVAFDTSNLLPVARAFRNKYLNITIFVCADDDRWTDGNPGVTAANEVARQVSGVEVIIPTPSSLDSKPTDFNDMAAIDGLDAVRECLVRTKTDFAPITYAPDFDPAAIPGRAWIILGLLLRGYITVGVAPPGVGKSVFALVIAIMVAIGKPLLNLEVREQTNVLVLNNEDDQDEINRRVAGICQIYNIPFGALTGKVFTLSGYGYPHLIAQYRDKNTVVATAVKGKLIEFCRKNDIGLIITDPYVSTHDVPENDNTAIEKVMSVYRAIANEAGVAFHLIHHTGKNNTEHSEAHAGNADAGRGASSLVGAARIVFTLARMSRKTADEAGIDWELGNRLFRFDDGKVNYALKSEQEKWFELKSVALPNGDSVGVPVPFDMASIAKSKKEERAEEKTKENEVKVTDTAVIVAKIMTEDRLPQTEVVSAYMAETGKKNTVSREAISMLSVGRPNATRVMVGYVATNVWRERHGSETRPRYTVHRMAEE